MNERNENVTNEEQPQQPEQEMDPWKAFRQNFRGIHNLKDAERLLELMQSLKAKKKQFNNDIASL